MLMDFLLFLLNCYMNAFGCIVGDVNQTKSESIMVVHCIIGSLIGLTLCWVLTIKFCMNEEWYPVKSNKKIIVLSLLVTLLYFFVVYLVQGKELI